METATGDSNNPQVDMASGDFNTSMSEITLSRMLLVGAAVVMFVGNLTVIVKAVRSKVLQGQVSNAFIVNLAIADSAIGLLLAAMTPAALGFNMGQFTEAWCRTVCAAIYCCITVTTLTLACISIERDITVLPSLTYGNYQTRCRVQVTITYTWLQGLITGCAPFILKWIMDNKLEEFGKAQWHLKYKFFFASLCMFLPSAAILTYYNFVVSDVEKHTEFPGRAGPEAAFPALLPSCLHDKTSIDHTKQTVESMLVNVFIFFSFMIPVTSSDCSGAVTGSLLPYASTFWFHIMVLWQVLLIPLPIISLAKNSAKNVRKWLNI